MVSGHSQSFQLTGLGKSLPLIFQQKQRLNCKRRVYSDHTKGTPQLPRFGDRGGCALQNTYYIRSHYQDIESKQLHLIHRNKHRGCQNEETNMAQMKEQIKTPERELNEMEVSNLSDAEFRSLVIRMLKELNEDLSSIRKKKEVSIV